MTSRFKEEQYKRWLIQRLNRIISHPLFLLLCHPHVLMGLVPSYAQHSCNSSRQYILNIINLCPLEALSQGP